MTLVIRSLSRLRAARCSVQLFLCPRRVSQSGLYLSEDFCSFCDSPSASWPCHVIWGRVSGGSGSWRRHKQWMWLVSSFPPPRSSGNSQPPTYSHFSWPAPWSCFREAGARCSWLLVRTLGGATSRKSVSEMALSIAWETSSVLEVSLAAW